MTAKRALTVKRKPAVRTPTDQNELLPEVQRRRMEVCRLRIDTSKLIDRVQGHAFGKIKMTPSQLDAATLLLRKTLPDLISAKTEINFTPVIFNFKMDPPALPAIEAE